MAKCSEGQKVYVRDDGDCIVKQRKPFNQGSALLYVESLKNGCHFWIEECAVVDSHLAAKEALR